MLIEIHMIQNHSPSNLNRDDMGAPKTCIFGGVTRARISSQCLKRSIRNPGRPENWDDPDAKRTGASSFAEVMGEHIGVRTKLFPWLVLQELENTNIPKDEHERIRMKAERIATAKEKEQRASEKDKADPRPMTPQLISFGRGDAKRFVAKLVELRNPDNGANGTSDRYDYFLNPRVGFEEMVRECIGDSDLDKKVIDKIVKAAWVIAKCRMSQLGNDDAGEETDKGTSDNEPSQASSSESQDQPGENEAKRIVDALGTLSRSDANVDKDRFIALTKGASREENAQIKVDAPKKPEKMKDFISSLKGALTCKAVDIALFGRMTTSDYFENMEAAMQVAHAISTHAVVNEVDYWTAVDDLGKAGGGSGHLGEAMFNSACFYKYFCLDWDQLVNNLAGPEPDKKKDEAAHKKWKDEIEPEAKCLAACTLGHFIRAAAITTPSGKQNSFASHTEACGILVEIKQNGKHPTNYANAFAEPVERTGKWSDDGPDYVSLEGRSIARFGDHIFNLREAYGIDSTLLWHAMPLYRFPLQGWKREGDGRKKRDENGKELPPVPHVDWDIKPSGGEEKSKHRALPCLGGNGTGGSGLVEAVIEALEIKTKDENGTERNLTWRDVMNVGGAQPDGAAS